MWFHHKLPSSDSKIYTQNSITSNLIVGGIIGFISGLLGIGGGVFLAPYLYISRWDKGKIIAATTSLFILVNSISGLLGHYKNPNFTIDIPFTIALGIAVFIGGQIGSRLVIKSISPYYLRKTTALLMMITV